MRYLSEIFWRHSWDVCTLVPIDSEILVCLSVYYLAYFLTKITINYITPVLDKISFSNFLEIFLGCCYICYKWFWISCMSVSLLVCLLPYWNYENKGISPVLEEISFWNFLETYLGCLCKSSRSVQFLIWLPVC